MNKIAITIAKFDGKTAGGGPIRIGQPIHKGTEYNTSTGKSEEGWVITQILRPVQARIAFNGKFRTITASDDTADVFAIDLRNQGSLFCGCQTPENHAAAWKATPTALRFRADSDAAICPACGQGFEFTMSLHEAYEAQDEICRKMNAAYCRQQGK